MQKRVWIESFARVYGGLDYADIAEIDGRADLAFVRGTYTETFSFAGVEEPQEIAGKFLWVLEKQPDGRWLVTVGISNSNGPPAETGI